MANVCKPGEGKGTKNRINGHNLLKWKYNPFKQTAMRSKSDGGRHVGRHHAHHSAGTRTQSAMSKNAINAAKTHVAKMKNTLETHASGAPCARVAMVRIRGES